VRQVGYLLELYRDARLPEYKISRKKLKIFSFFIKYCHKLGLSYMRLFMSQ